MCLYPEKVKCQIVSGRRGGWVFPRAFPPLLPAVLPSFRPESERIFPQNVPRVTDTTQRCVVRAQADKSGEKAMVYWVGGQQYKGEWANNKKNGARGVE